MWNRGQSQQSQLVLPTYTSTVQYDYDAALHQLSATNTSLNSNEEGTATVEYLISQDMQWVLNLQSVDNIQQLHELEAYQSELSSAIKQRPTPTRKRSPQMDHRYTIDRQHRQRVEEQRYPSFLYFGSISSSCENNIIRHLSPPLEHPLSKHVCLVEPTLRPTHYFHPGGSNVGVGPTGGSIGMMHQTTYRPDGGYYKYTSDGLRKRGRGSKQRRMKNNINN